MLNFPDAPVVNQTYTDGTTAWKWDGAKWVTTLLFSDAPSDSSTYGRRNAAWNKVLPLTGGTLTGDLTVNALNLIVGTSTTAGANLTLNSVSPPSSNLDAGIKLQSAGRNRWWVHLNGIEGGGANFGSNFVINRHDDAGVWLDSPLVISRWSGIVSFTASPTGPTPPPGDGSPKFATTAFVKTGYLPLTGGILTGPAIASDFTVGTNTASSTFALNGPANSYRTIQFYTAALSRWAVYVSPETGSGNGGSDFIFNRYNDAGTFIDAPLKITRATGDVTLGSKLVVAGDTTLYAALYVNGSGSFGIGSAAVGITFNGSVSNRLISIQSAGVGRWQFGANPDAESSPAVGSNFVIYRFDNAGGYLGTALQIDRATGNITVGGNLTVAATNLVINGPAGSTRQFLYQTAGSLRWLVAATSTAEAAGNVGSDYAIGRCDNTGTYIDLPLVIARSTGDVTLGHNLTVTGQATTGAVLAGTLGLTGNLGGGTPPGGNVAMGWNYASGSGEFDFFNNYQGAATAFSFWQKTATTYAQIMLLSPAGNLSLTGGVAASGATISGILIARETNGRNIQMDGNGATTPNKTILAHNGNFDIVNHAYNSIPFSMTDVGAVTITHVDASGLYALTLTNTLGGGVGLRLVGNGATTPNKTLRSSSGWFQIVNDAYTAVILGLSDTGRLLVGFNVVDDGATPLQVSGSAVISGHIYCGDGGVSSVFGFQASGTSLQTSYIPNSWDFFDTSILRRNFVTAGLVVASMNSDGSFTIAGGTAVKPGGGAWVAPSDERIKTVHGAYEQGLDAICALQPVRYSYLGNATLTAPPEDEDETPQPKRYLAPADQDGTERIGLIAQAVEGTFPECVTATLGYIDGEEVDDMRHLDTSPMLFALCNAVRELRDRVVELEAAAR